MRDAHRLLREATRDAHERLDGLFTGFELSSQQGYRRFIGAQAEALLPVEAALDDAGAGRVTADWPERRRGVEILRDATALGITIEQQQPPSYRSDAEIAGALYVLEGSRHGARLLRQQIPALATSYFLDTNQAAGSWGKLLDRIDAILYDEPLRDAAVAAAIATFGVFERSGRLWMAKA